MILSAHQPAYLPWLGYFDKIKRSDIFIYLDNVQYEKNSFTNRNKIKTPQGPQWMTIPVKSKDHMSSSMNVLQIDNTQKWKEKHLKAIFINYKKAPRFEDVYDKVERSFLMATELFSEFVFLQLQFWLKELKIETPVILGSQIEIISKRSDLILDLCKHFNADHYLSGALGKDYLVNDDFIAAGITVEFQAYNHPVYPQLWGEFIPCMSIVDFLMNTDNIDLI